MIKRQNKIKGLFALLLLLSFGGAFAQQSFKYQATLRKVDSSGFYRIMLQPDLCVNSSAHQNGADIRLVDQQNKFVPYLFGTQLPVKGEKEFIVFPKSPASKETDTATIFIVENTNRYTISRLLFNAHYADAMRFVTLSGSNDLKHWYAILDNEILALLNGSLKFSASNYQYFKITISHRHQEPIEILQAGIERQQLVPPTYVQVPIATFTQKDSGKTSFITIRFSEHYLVNKLKFDIDGPKYYKRKVLLHEEHNGERFLSSNLDDLTSTGAQVLYLSQAERKLVLEIENNDDQPLKIKGITAYQDEQSMISYLEKGKQYSILFGDSNAIPPDYDLKFFTDSLHKTLPIIQHGLITPNPLYQAKQVKTEKGIPAWVIWLAIIVVLAVLGLLTFKMAGEVNKRSAEEKV
jgi:hypothetical protein